MTRGERRKNHKSQNKAVDVKKPSAKKRACPVEELANEPVADFSGSNHSEEEDGNVYQYSSMYDNLLKALKSSNAELAKMYKRRRRDQEGISDTEDEDSGFTSAIASENSDDDEESGGESSLAQSPGDEDEGSDEAGKEDEASDKDDCNTVDETDNKSSFHLHLEHILTNEELNYPSKMKCEFKWEMPVVDMPAAKWAGTKDKFLNDISSDLFYGLKEKLFKHWLNIFGTSASGDFHSSRQRFFFSLCNSYQDVMHCNKKPFYLKGSEVDSSIMDAYIMHALNHINRTRDLVTKNNAKQAKNQEGQSSDMLHGGTFLDHGFTRPKVLILLPLASIALRVVKRLIQLTPPSNKVNVEGIDRFLDEFGTGEAEAEDDENDGSSKPKKSTKPVDFQLLFGGNNNDHFMVGIKFTKRSIKMYNDFYSSDIIVASPLGLITKIGEAEVEKDKDVDYLSSIEVLIIDHADVIAMQNWSHVDTVVQQLNCKPSKQHGTDVMRIRQWYLDGHAHFYRQTILLGSFVNPEMNALFNQHCANYEGKVKLISKYKGVLPKVLLQVRQVFERFDANSIVEAGEARFDYFSKKVFPKIKDSLEGGTLLFISSYFEFVKIRNFLKSQNASFCLLGEYTKPSDISRARLWFFEGKRKIMLYTERAFFYHRYKIRGIQNLIIYSLPERKEFHPEILNMLEYSKSMTCNVLFSQFDYLRLERIVGTAAAKRMLSSDKGIFVFS